MKAKRVAIFPVVTMLMVVMGISLHSAFGAASIPFYFDVEVADTFSIEELDTHPASISYSAESQTNNVVAVISGVTSSQAAEFAALHATVGSLNRKTFTVEPQHGALVGMHNALNIIPYTLSYKMSGTSSYIDINATGKTSFHWTPSSSQVGKTSQVCVFAVSIEPTHLEGGTTDTYSDSMTVEMVVE